MRDATRFLLFSRGGANMLPASAWNFREASIEIFYNELFSLVLVRLI
jgi:hypothetical protein